MAFYKASDNVTFLNQNQTSKLLDIIEKSGNIRDIAIFHIAYYCGLRASEIGLICYQDINFHTKTLFCKRLKGSISNTIKLDRKRFQYLKNYCDSLKIYDDMPIFMSRNKQPITRQRLHQLMKFYAKKAQLPADKRHFHILKHSIAVHLFDSGLGFSDVQQHLGHVSIQSAEIYIKYSARRLNRANIILNSSKYIS